MSELYQAWASLLDWMRAYAEEKGLLFIKEAHFPDAIYRLQRKLDLPTTVMTASIAFPENEERLLLASASPPWAREEGVEMRIMKAHLYLHLHLGEEGLEYEGRAFTERRLRQIADRALLGLRP